MNNLLTGIDDSLKEYIESEILPQYDTFDRAHQREHAAAVIAESLRLSQFYETDVRMVYTIAAYHDVGLRADRETHHTVSAQIMRGDQMLRKWFDEAQIEQMAQAAEDHRASSKHEPRSIYGKIVAEADRQIEKYDIVKRTITYGLSHLSSVDKEAHWGRTLEHLHEKYAEGGYVKLWLPESDNAQRLQELRELIKDEVELRKYFEHIYNEYAHVVVRESREEDIPRIMKMYEHSRIIMRSNGNLTQWANGYPSEEAVRADIERGHNFVIEREGEIVGTFAFIIGEDPTYANIEGGEWADGPLPYGTIHRLACAEGMHGVGRCCIDWCSKKVSQLRADTHADNSIMQHILEKAKFEYRGIIYVADGTPRKAYQRF